MKFLTKNLPPLGLGCWPIGGPMFAADGQSLGYANSDDNESIRAIHAAIAHGIQLFDTAAAYGAGHSERLLGKALKHHPDVSVVTKIGLAMDEKTKTLIGEDANPDNVVPAIERCLRRLDRESIDLVMLHINSLAVDKAAPVFDAMQKALQQGKIKAYGWSTDHATNVSSMAGRPGFKAVQHAMHVLMDAPVVQKAIQQHELHAMIRSPLAMGLLSGKYTVQSTLPKNDIRATNQGWHGYYVDGKPNPKYIQILETVRELLQTDGRTIVQGAIGWLWGKSANNIPIPGARTVKQVEGIAAALMHGALPADTLAELDKLLRDVPIADGKSER